MGDNPYTDRMNEIARLRTQIRLIQRQIGDEITKAWRLSPVQSLEVFAQNLGMEVEEVRKILEAKGIFVRIQPTIPGVEGEPTG